MLSIIFVCTAVLFRPALSEGTAYNEDDLLVLTISSKIWNLLETKSVLINNATAGISFGGFSGTKKSGPPLHKSLIKYSVSGGRIQQFSIPKSDVLFCDGSNGIYVKMKNIFVQTTVHVETTIKKRFLKERKITGDVVVRTKNADLEVVLLWENFTLVPNVRLISGFRTEFPDHLQRVDFLSSDIQNQVANAVDNLVPAMVSNMVHSELNPRLQSLKRSLSAIGFLNVTDFDERYTMQWTVQHNTLRFSLKPKSENGVISPVKPINKMLCVSGNLRRILEFTQDKQRNKRVVFNYSISCEAPEFECKGASCSFCTDIDINPASEGGGDTLKQCFLKL